MKLFILSDTGLVEELLLGNILTITVIRKFSNHKYTGSYLEGFLGLCMEQQSTVASDFLISNCSSLPGASDIIPKRMTPSRSTEFEEDIV